MLIPRYDEQELRRLESLLHRKAQEIAEMAEERMLDARVPLPNPEDVLSEGARD